MEFVLLPVLPIDNLESLVFKWQLVQGNYQPDECHISAKSFDINNFWGDVFL
jgi:hypothetical protein